MEYYIKKAELESAVGKVDSYSKLKELCDYIIARVTSDMFCMGLSKQAEDYLLDCDCYFVDGNCVEILGSLELIERTLEIV